jgi:DNA-binding transcriptional MerR regulator
MAVAELEPLVFESDVPPFFGDVTPRTIARWREKSPDLWKPDLTINGRRLYTVATIKRIQAAMGRAA